MFVRGDGGGEGLDPCVHFLLDRGRDTGKTWLRGVSEHVMFGPSRAAPLTRFTVPKGITEEWRWLQLSFADEFRAMAHIGYSGL